MKPIRNLLAEWRPHLPTILWTALAFPVAVLSHEAAHFAAYLYYGFPDPQLHFGSASFEGGGPFWKLARAGEWEQASAVVEPFQAGVASAAGIVASWLVMLLCCLLVWRWPHPFFAGLGFIAALRFLGSVFILALGRVGRNGSDEEHVAMIFGLSELLLHLFGIASMLLTWFALFRCLAPKNRMQTAGLIGLGAVVGGILYIAVLGPLLLP